MEGIPSLTEQQLNILIPLIRLQKNPTGFTFREIGFNAPIQKTPSVVHGHLKRLEKKGVIKGNASDSKSNIKASRFSYSTDIELIETENVAALVRMFD